MFDSLSTGNQVAPKEFRAREKALVKPLLDAQFALRELEVPAKVIIGGIPAVGRGGCVDRIVGWLDSRFVTVHAMSPPTDVELQYPFFFRYWERLPWRGRIAVVFGAWYRSILEDRVWGRLPDDLFRARLQKVVALEKMLVADGVLLRKYWLHLSQEQHGERLARIEASPAERWRLQPEDWLAHARYGAYAAAAHEMLEASHHADAPWVLVDAADARYRDITVGESLLAAFQRRAERPAVPPPTDRALATQEWTNPIANVTRVDLVDKDAYEAELAELQGRLGRLGRAMSRVGRSLVLVFEGQDAAGKGGSIRRLTGGLDSRLYRVHATSAPTPEERGFPWLWRFWKHLPRRGNTAIFDRSWYGRVLVERVEGFASVPDWERAYEEIREFERQLVTAGAVVVKFWLAVSFDEQLRRFEDRESSGAKRHKLTDEDWRNREKWGEYEAAAVEMYHRTHRADAPWYIIDADHKRYARLCVLRAVCEEIERRLELGTLPPSARF